MNSLRKWVRDIFGFSGTEINGFLILLPLTLILVLSEPVYHSWVASRIRHPEGSHSLDSILTVWNAHQNRLPDTTMNPMPLFAFDPNRATISDLEKLGVPGSLAKRIAAYRSKGGVFNVKSDLLKIYDLDSALYKQLYDYIRLPSSRVRVSGVDKPHDGPRFQSFEKPKGEQIFDINAADTTLLKSVYGIGPALARRIIKFRDGLGGFISKEQLYEVYGLDSVVVIRLLKITYISPGFVPERMNINTADEKQMAKHPYISFTFARAMANYRFQHGDFPDVNDIKKLSVLSTEDLERLLPYLKVSD